MKMSNDRTERALLYKCLICGQIFKCFFGGIYSCDGCLRDPKDCPKTLPHTLKDESSGLCPVCREKRKETWQWWGCGRFTKNT